MNISKLKKLATVKKLSIKELSEKVGISETGMYKALKKGDFKISTLEKISAILDVPVGYFFEESSKNTGDIIGSQNYNVNNISIILDSKQQEIEYLKRELLLKDKIIQLLENKSV